MLHARSDYDHIQDSTGRIPELEPVFLIRGQNDIAAETVRYWARRNLETGGDPKLSEWAEAHAVLMDAWPTKKKADA